MKGLLKLVYLLILLNHRKPDIAPAIEIAISRAMEMQELTGEVNELNNKLETRKIVEKAKGYTEQ